MMVERVRTREKTTRNVNARAYRYGYVADARRNYRRGARRVWVR